MFKHAFPNSGKGEISINLYREENGTINIHLADDGVGIPAGMDLREDSSMGLNTVFSLVDYQLNGEVTYEAGAGLKWHLKLNDNKHKARV
ncbi:MAG: hypothetical protein ISS80_03515 [Candidatus Cloacimonetes bacterium]|nr:hypothetical protein [Candidatus Cloacimonadota bacterium]MBL7149120.1 hypothetical protein [Candidatus Cloacimonadota bacterium]